MRFAGQRRAAWENSSKMYLDSIIINTFNNFFHFITIKPLPAGQKYSTMKPLFYLYTECYYKTIARAGLPMRPFGLFEQGEELFHARI
ncbi:hypothetical protein [Megasphaera stantonii]|uniref:hypothetical protein n=1 Tax=Megasphaera stantonii TaxID=2144175 RepID=UPI0013C34280|nr:hypothetical protein [Megasphaera stantonii]